MANVIDPVCFHADTTPDNIALRGADSTLTYRQLQIASTTYAGALREWGISPGDRVLLAAPSVPEFVVAYLAIQAAGAVVVPVNTMSTRPETEYVLSDAGVSLAILWYELGPAMSQAAAALDVPVWTLSPEIVVSDGLQKPIVDRDGEDTAAILYTSGTTGRPKGAELTVGNLLSGGQIGAECSRGSSEDRTGTGLPLFHVFGQASVMMATFTGGGSLSLLARFDPSAMLAMLRRDRLTIMAGVPTMWNAMLHAAGDADPEDFAQLRIAISGGASLPGEVARAFETRFGCTILEGYGLTETTAFGTFNDIDRGGKIGYTGRAVPRMEVEVRDHDGNQCTPGTVGEVFVKGPTVMKGYWRRPVDTADVLSPDGWFRTGDLGCVDSDGDLRIVDRVKDLIIRGGYNVYPSEIEEVLYTHPDVVEAAVVGVPDDHYGEEVAAVVALLPGSELDGAELTRWTRERLSAYKIPRIISIVDALPKGSTGKILKRSIDKAALRTDPLTVEVPRKVTP
ncbi:class I adenylate-forming enzyme family protein [Rhodococcus sp. WAY2]|uniref:class I adenylate-forming enzyme family protein n=1 Tax=Rhodococcus sp. WAY2 TaxID=2663121 RepID=UPI0013202017|nr:AMP-binding protein [Rhodococcus sp. WAY2]QHE68736.1 Long-chain-fatty-acid--CoA ligase [Rhodococcus sp. WAY2]